MKRNTTCPFTFHNRYTPPLYDCAVCVAECPVNAIYAEEDVPGDQQQFIKLNADLARFWPSITKTKPALPDAEEWKDVKDKLDQLAR